MKMRRRRGIGVDAGGRTGQMRSAASRRSRLEERGSAMRGEGRGLGGGSSRARASAGRKRLCREIGNASGPGEISRGWCFACPKRQAPTQAATSPGSRWRQLENGVFRGGEGRVSHQPPGIPGSPTEPQTCKIPSGGYIRLAFRTQGQSARVHTVAPPKWGLYGIPRQKWADVSG